MSPECDTTTKNHNKIKQNETCKSKQKKNPHCVKWIHNFSSSCTYMYIISPGSTDCRVSTMSWYLKLSFEHTAKPCLSNFRTNKKIIGLTNFILWKKKCWSRFPIISLKQKQLYIYEYMHHPQKQDKKCSN